MIPLRVLAYAREAGGAAAMAPVLRALTPAAQLVTLANAYAHDVFHRAGVPVVTFTEFSEPALDRVLSGRWEDGRPGVLFTPATSLPHVDMTEKYLWRWAKRQGIRSVSVLDQWQNYALRFSGPTPLERLGYVPDWIAAMDARAKRGLVAAGIPDERVVVTGQPAFDHLAELRRSYVPADRQRLRQAIGVAPETLLVCFVTEAFARVFGEQLGYTEHTVLSDCLSVCARIAARTGRPLHVAVKLHPVNTRQEFEWIRTVALPPELRVSVHGTEQPPLPLVMASDAVIGMMSVLLVESILLGRPTMSFQPHTRQEDGLIATVVGAIPLLKRVEDCERTLHGLLQDAVFRAAYLQRQTRLSMDGCATARVAELVRRVGAVVSVGEAE